uniref:pilin N-terminal domain-containing protein n=1 Tax=Streptococcus suis TaxID=1307 RepID=UPI000492CACB
MKKLTKLFSLLTVLVTILGPLGNIRHLVHADDTQQPQQTKVFVHKILLNKEQFADFDHEAKKDGYNGNQIGTITDYFGSSAKEIAGVNFKVWKKVDQAQDKVTKTGDQLGISGDGANENYKLMDGEYGTNGVVTGENNAGAEFTLPNGTYIFVEDKANSPYYNKQEGNELTEAKAVPFRLVLPVTLPDGTGYFNSTDNPLHV